MGFFGGGLGGSVGGAAVDLILNDTGFERGLTAADARLKTFGSSAGHTVARISKGISTGLLAIGAAAGAVAGITIKAALDEQEALVALNGALGRNHALRRLNINALKAQALAIGQLTGFNSLEVISGAAVLARFARTQKQFEELLPLTIDYARRIGVDVPTAATNLGRALVGNMRALKSLGIEYKATTTAQDAVKSKYTEMLHVYEADHKHQDAAITAYKLQQKGLEALALAHAKTKDRMVDFGHITDMVRSKVANAAADFAGTDAGRIDIMREKLHQTEMTIGNQLLPIFDKLTTIVSGALDWFSKLSPATQANIIKFGLLAGALGVVIKILTPVVGLVVRAIGALISMAGAESAATAASVAQAAALTADATAFTLYTASASGAVVATHTFTGATVGAEAAVGGGGLLGVIGPAAIGVAGFGAALYLAGKGAEDNARKIAGLADTVKQFGQQSQTGQIAFNQLAVTIGKASMGRAGAFGPWVAGSSQVAANLAVARSNAASLVTLLTAANFVGGAAAAGSIGYRYSPDTTRGGGPRQHGGPVGAGISYLVGETGPEWFIPKVSGRVLPHGTSPSGAGININIYNPTFNGEADLERKMVAVINRAVSRRLPA